MCERRLILETFYEALPADMKDTSDTLAYTGLKKIAKLFVIEKEIDTFPPENKVKIRQEKSKPLVDDFFSLNITEWQGHSIR